MPSSVPAAGLRPMKAVSDVLPTGEGWAYEVKWDGMRVMAEVGPDGVVLRNARGALVTDTYPELATVNEALGGHNAVLDGEVVAMDDAGRPSFSRIQQRMHVADALTALQRSHEVPVVYIVFDLLALDGAALLDSPWAERRARLEAVVQPGGVVQLPPAYREGGAELLQAARDTGLEGVMAKRVDSPYRPGRRSPAWRKVKVRHTQEFVVAGWLGGQGAREATVGSLVLGCHRDGALRWAGNVGSGLDEEALRFWTRRVADAATDRCPLTPAPTRPTARRARWVEPVEVVQVEFGEWTPERRLRHPVYLGRRDDKAAAEVTCED